MKKRPLSLSLRRGIHVKNHHRFLRPGALARIRDNKLISLSLHHRSTPFLLLSPPSSPSSPHQQSPAVDQHTGGSLCFLGKRMGGSISICPQRKKLSASKYVFFVPSSPNLADPVVDLFGSDLVAAH
ncbi:hypothetical protein FCM35_KLT15443 [Carex littledalei]|uniref:Uncharacterized protein n=1 Tax=Carex littledalei TaxID=544730 RepID=A0A833VGW6_9POAL|nr:hypothetical protein FCM35_KLT15443 [Carex littledalei]